MNRTLVLGSRGSDLALWQSRWVAARLAVATELRLISTQGDRVLDRDLSGAEGKGFFTKELEDALYARDVDLAVHSLKDLPTQTPPGLVVAAVCERAPVADVLLVHPDFHDPNHPFPVKAGGRVGASSLRRQAFVRAARSDVQPASLRGNVPTRVRKCQEGQYAAVVLAEAGLSRLALKFAPLHAYRLDPHTWLPAPGQGALVVETRDEADVVAALAGVNHEPTRHACDVERRLLARFEGGCHLPLGTLARFDASGIRLTACFAPTPERLVRCEVVARDANDVVEAAFTELHRRDAAGDHTTFDGAGLCERIDAWS